MAFAISRADLKKPRTFGRDRDQALADATGLNVEAFGAATPAQRNASAVRVQSIRDQIEANTAPKGATPAQRPVFQPAPDDFAATGVSEADINARRVQYITPDMVKAQAETIFRRESGLAVARMEDVLQPKQIAELLLRAEGEVRQNAANPSFLAGLGAFGETLDATARPVRTFVDEFGPAIAEVNPLTAPLALIDDLRNDRPIFGDTRRFLSDPGAIGEGLDRTLDSIVHPELAPAGRDLPGIRDLSDVDFKDLPGVQRVGDAINAATGGLVTANLPGTDLSAADITGALGSLSLRDAIGGGAEAVLDVGIAGGLLKAPARLLGRVARPGLRSLPPPRVGQGTVPVRPGAAAQEAEEGAFPRQLAPSVDEGSIGRTPKPGEGSVPPSRLPGALKKGPTYTFAGASDALTEASARLSAFPRPRLAQADDVAIDLPPLRDDGSNVYVRAAREGDLGQLQTWPGRITPLDQVSDTLPAHLKVPMQIYERSSRAGGPELRKWIETADPRFFELYDSPASQLARDMFRENSPDGRTIRLYRGQKLEGGSKEILEPRVLQSYSTSPDVAESFAKREAIEPPLTPERKSEIVGRMPLVDEALEFLNSLGLVLRGSDADWKPDLTPEMSDAIFSTVTRRAYGIADAAAYQADAAISPRYAVSSKNRADKFRQLADDLLRDSQEARLKEATLRRIIHQNVDIDDIVFPIGTSEMELLVMERTLVDPRRELWRDLARQDELWEGVLR